MRAGHPKETGVGEDLVVRIAHFATNMWRTINGEPIKLESSSPGDFKGNTGICSSDAQLRCSLLASWQWLWGKGCPALIQVQVRKSNEWTKGYNELGVDRVMKTSEQEKICATEEEKSLSDLHRLVSMELDRQIWRSEMAMSAYTIYKTTKSTKTTSDASSTELGIGQPLPPIARDRAFKQGGWIASCAQQRRKALLDGGIAVSKIRLKM